jgi:hypothetical protein
MVSVTVVLSAWVLGSYAEDVSYVSISTTLFTVLRWVSVSKLTTNTLTSAAALDQEVVLQKG